MQEDLIKGRASLIKGALFFTEELKLIQLARYCNTVG